MATGRQRLRLAEFVIQDRSRLYRSRRAFAAAADVSSRTIDKLETGQPVEYRPRTVAAVEDALEWRRGSIDRVLGGGRPAYVDDPLRARLDGLWPQLSPDARAMLVRLAEQAVTDSTDTH